jgi:hypothetical protein
MTGLAFRTKAAALAHLNAGGYLRERPEGWLWMHRCWPKQIYRAGGGPWRGDACRHDACDGVI